MNAIPPALFVSLIALAGASAILLACTRRRDPVDDDACVQLGPVADAPVPHLIATVCAQCGAVKCTDRRWLPARLVRLPECSLSHGLCPICARAAEDELDRVLPKPATQALPHLCPANA